MQTNLLAYSGTFGCLSGWKTPISQTRMSRVNRRRASPRASQRAKEIAEELRIDEVTKIDLELIAAQFKAFIRYRPLKRQQGHIIRGERMAIIVVNSELYGRPRARWVIAHELGHHLLHRHIDQYMACTRADLATYHASGHEPEANQFAAELLMPAKIFEHDCDRNKPDLEDVKELSDKYGTSLTATAIRLASFSPEPCAAVISRDGRVCYSSRSGGWKYYIPNGHSLSRSSYAGDLHAGRDAPKEPRNVEASAWTTTDWAKDHDLQEHSMALGRTGLVLSMLWAPSL